MFGHILATLEDFSHSLQPVPAEKSLNNTAPDLHGQAHCGEIEFIVKRASKAPVIHESWRIFPEAQTAQSKPASLFIYKNQNTLRIVYLDFAIYDISGHCITCYPARQTSDKQLHLNFLGPIMSMWLEQNSFLVLHASAILINDKVVLFLADSQQGKSTLAAMMINTGYRLLSDDLLAIKYNQLENQYLTFPSYPVIKLWPDQFSRLFENDDPSLHLDKDLKKCRVRVDAMNPELFCEKPHSLSMIYCLHRGQVSEKLCIEPVSKIEAMTRLIRYSFAAPVMIATGWQSRRMEVFSNMVSDIPVRDLKYPSDILNLPFICKSIVNDAISAN